MYLTLRPSFKECTNVIILTYVTDIHTTMTMGVTINTATSFNATTTATKFENTTTNSTGIYPLNISISYDIKIKHRHYGNRGCGIFKGGIQNKKGFCIRINIPKGYF